MGTHEARHLHEANMPDNDIAITYAIPDIALLISVHPGLGWVCGQPKHKTGTAPLLPPLEATAAGTALRNLRQQ